MYSIWIIPPEPTYSQLTSIIRTVSQKYAGPLFEPHMTVLGNIELELSEIESKTRMIAKSIDGLQLSLGPLSFSTTYFQSVFVRVDTTAVLAQLNLDLKKALGRVNDVFMPHVSLLYGDHAMGEREKIVREITLPEQQRFIATRLTIVPATNDPHEWKHLSSIPFSAR